MAMSKEEIIEAIADMSVMDVVELVEAMEEKFGVSAAAVAAAPVAAGPSDGADGAAEEQTEFDVVLASFGDKKINVIKEEISKVYFIYLEDTFGKKISANTA